MEAEPNFRHVRLLLQENTWRKFRAPKGVVTPKGRRSHTATVFQVSRDPRATHRALTFSSKFSSFFAAGFHVRLRRVSGSEGVIVGTLGFPFR